MKTPQQMQPDALEGRLQPARQIHVALRDVAARLPRRAEGIHHVVGEVTADFHLAAGVNADGLLRAEGQEPAIVETEAVVSEAQHVVEVLAVGIFAVGRQAHHLAFVTVAAVADELAQHGIE